ncbi:LUD domain-containing protein [Aeromonas dhakensis]|uniref:LUD domain-containing protein n=1 Tax=Aeromonas dhakensis TaxID=196024 RepID=UPI003D1B3F6B
MTDTLLALVAFSPIVVAAVLLVSGPSKTADIQQTLAYGAHGPSRLLVVLVEDC